MLSRLSWFIAAGLVAVWTLVAWGGDAILSKLLDFSASNVHAVLPTSELADWAIWSLHGLDDMSGPIVGIVWLAVTVFIFGAAWLVSRLSGRARGTVPARPQFRLR